MLPHPHVALAVSQWYSGGGWAALRAKILKMAGRLGLAGAVEQDAND